MGGVAVALIISVLIGLGVMKCKIKKIKEYTRATDVVIQTTLID